MPPVTSIITQETTFQTMTSPKTTTVLSISNEATSTFESTTNNPQIDFKIVTRFEWNATAPRTGIKNVTLSLKRIILTHTADQMNTCNTDVSNRKM